MPDIAMQIDIPAPADTVYRALTTTDGIAGWWTNRNETTGLIGETERFHFPGAPMAYEMRVEQAEPAKLLSWRCVGGPPEWVDTDIRWTLQPTDDGTLVLLDHAGWAEVSSMFRIVTVGWVQMIMRLRQYLETGAPDPFFQH